MFSVRFVGQISWNCFKKMFSAKFSLPPKLVPDHLEAKRKRGGGVGRSPIDIQVARMPRLIQQEFSEERRGEEMRECG